jgi:uncharacterized protein (DUF433 family)
VQATAAELIAQYIEPTPHRPGPADVRLRDYCVPVWTLIGYWRAAEGDLEHVAADYEIPREAVEAAIAHYKRNKAVIDGRLAANSL